VIGWARLNALRDIMYTYEEVA